MNPFVNKYELRLHYIPQKQEDKICIPPGNRKTPDALTGIGCYMNIIECCFRFFILTVKMLTGFPAAFLTVKSGQASGGVSDCEKLTGFRLFILTVKILTDFPAAQPEKTFLMYFGAFAFSDYKPYGRCFQVKGFPYVIFEVAFIRKMHKVGFVHKDDKGRRLRAYLR